MSWVQCDTEQETNHLVLHHLSLSEHLTKESIMEFLILKLAHSESLLGTSWTFPETQHVSVPRANKMSQTVLISEGCLNKISINIRWSYVNIGGVDFFPPVLLWDVEKGFKPSLHSTKTTKDNKKHMRKTHAISKTLVS